MGTVTCSLYPRSPSYKLLFKFYMDIRSFQTVRNLHNSEMDVKRVTRSSRRVLGEVPLNTQHKSNIVANISDGLKPRLSKSAGRRPIYGPVNDETPMEVESVDVSKLVLPAGIKDIDVDDSFNPQLCSEYAKETFVYLKQLELRGAVKPDFLLGCPTTDKMRAVLVDWLVEVQIQFKLVQETLYLTVDTIDRYLNVKGKTVHRSRLQLVAVAAMFLISKIKEVYAPTIADFVYITDNAYTESQIRKMELDIIQALKFDLCQPVSLNFLRRYSKAGDVDVLQHSLAKYVLETSLLDDRLAPVPGSLLASASLCLSLLLLESSVSVDAVWSPSLQYYSGYSTESVLPMVSKLASNILKLNNRSCTLHAVRNKYKSGKFMKVADLGALKSEKILKILKLAKLK